MHRFIAIIFACLSLLSLGCGNHQQQDDILVPGDTLAISLSEYFDGHGTPNEQMLGHYILARTYAEMGEVSQALDEFQKAEACADTTATDCDRHLLARVHSQAFLLQEEKTESAGGLIWIVGGLVFLALLGVAGFLLKRKKKPQQQDSQEDGIQENRIYESDVYLRFRDLSKHPLQSISRDDWNALEMAVDEYLPDFRKKVDPNHNMKDTDYRICMLIRLRFALSEVAAFMDITPQNLYSRRKQLLKSVFNIVGKPDEFDALIQE